MKLKGYRGEFYFHVLSSDRKLGYGDGRIVVPGKELKAKKTSRQLACGIRAGIVPDEPIQCKYGMHGCSTARKLKKCARLDVGKWICLVRLNTRLKHFRNKHAALRRKVVFMRQVDDDFYSQLSPPCSMDWRGWPAKYSSRAIAKWIMEKPWTPERAQ